MLSQDEKLLQRIKLEKEKRDMIEAEGRREKEPNLVNISKALDEYYIYEKLKIYAAYLSYKAFTSDSFLTYNETDFEFLPSILSKVSMLDNPIIETYDLLRQLFENKDDLKKGYYERDEVLVNRILYLSSNYIEEMTEKETIQIYSFLTNFCLYKFNNGFLEYTSLFLIFNNNIVNTFYRNNENSNMKLPPGIFRNMIVAAMRLKNSNQIFNKIETVGISPKDDTIGFKDAIEWAESFISIYKKKISSKNYQIYYPYCEALIQFHNKKFGKAYRILNNPLRLQGMFINMDTRMLHLQVLFELFIIKPRILENDGIDIEKMLENFRGLIRDDENRKQQLSENHKAHYRHFDKLFRIIYQLQLKYGFIEKKPQIFILKKQQLTVKLNNTWYPFKSWMLEKLNKI